MEEGKDAIAEQHTEHALAHSDTSSNSREQDVNRVEKAPTAGSAYPMNDDDYVVTFKTWIVVCLILLILTLDSISDI
jgi:hypothetical protein